VYSVRRRNSLCGSHDSVLYIVWVAVFCLFVLGFSSHAYASSSELEHQLSQIFVKRSFTLRGFYQGSRLSYNSAGVLTSKAKPGYWSRDGMVLISSVKLASGNQLIMLGDRHCVEFDPASGEFSNVRTGDRVEIWIQLDPSQLTLESVIPVLQKVFITSHEKLADIAPSYWANCLSQKVNRPAKDALWECQADDKTKVPDLTGKKLEWEAPRPDNTLHNGTQLYLLEHRVAYIPEPGVELSRLQVAPDPLFRWEQRRVQLGQLTCVLSIVIGEDGKARDFSIVTPVGMGLDDDAVAAVKDWQFSPAKRDGQPVPIHARVVFLVTQPNTRPTLPLQSFSY
jgi:TonB family protein